MLQIRIHGRGGQGVVSAAEIISVAAFREGKHAQAFPSFGSERMGAPVMAFCRIDEREIRLREPIMTPDALIIQDPTLLHHVDLFQGLAADGYVLLNSGRSAEELGIDELFARVPRRHVCTLAASELAREHLGKPLPSGALLGGLAALTGWLQISSVQAALREKFAGISGERNAAAALAAFNRTRAKLAAQEGVHAQAD